MTLWIPSFLAAPSNRTPQLPLKIQGVSGRSPLTATSILYRSLQPVFSVWSLKLVPSSCSKKEDVAKINRCLRHPLAQASTLRLSLHLKNVVKSVKTEATSVFLDSNLSLTRRSILPRMERKLELISKTRPPSNLEFQSKTLSN